MSFAPVPKLYSSGNSSLKTWIIPSSIAYTFLARASSPLRSFRYQPSKFWPLKRGSKPDSLIVELLSWAWFDLADSGSATEIEMAETQSSVVAKIDGRRNMIILS